MTTSGVKANGDLYTDKTEYVRTEGTSGLLGSWKSTEVKLSSPNELIMQESGLDQMILKIPALNASGEVNFDGKEVAFQGPDIPPGFRVGLTRTGPYSFRLVREIEWHRDFLLGIHRLRRWQDDDRSRRGSRGPSLNWGLGKAITRVQWFSAL